MRTNLTYSTTEINQNFKIKVYGYNGDNNRINSLFGVKGLINLIGLELADTLIKRAFKNSFSEDVVVCKLRRGLKVSFYNI